MTRRCHGCSQLLKKKTSKEEHFAIYCSVLCHQQHISAEYIKAWLLGENNGSAPRGSVSKYVFNYLHRISNSSCWECGWSDRHPDDNRPLVEVDHKDGNPKNNSKENLRLLCPNCHSKTSTYRARNRKNFGVFPRKRIRSNGT